MSQLSERFLKPILVGVGVFIILIGSVVFFISGVDSKVSEEDSVTQNIEIITESMNVVEEDESKENLPGYRQIIALSEAYPDRLTETKILHDQWAFKMDDTWYIWAEGRLLPEAQHDSFQEYLEIRFYRYDLSPFSVPEYQPQQVERLRSWSNQGETDTRIRFNGFLDSLYQIDSEASADRKVVSLKVLGKSTRVHPLLEEPILRVNKKAEELRSRDPNVSAFMDNLHQVHGYNWRNIAGTMRRSYHSYGVAVDLVPYNYGGRFPYWRWALDAGIEDWWALDEDQRWHIPQSLIEIFESEGFIWGGKWTAFDSMHFEYRPEVISMAEDRFQQEIQLPVNEPVEDSQRR